MFVLITACTNKNYWYKHYIGQIIEIDRYFDKYGSYYGVDKTSVYNMAIMPRLKTMPNASRPIIMINEAVVVDSVEFNNQSMISLLKKDVDVHAGVE